MIRAKLEQLLKSSLVRNSAWMFGGQGVSLVVQAAYFVILARLLGTTQYGLLAGASALIGIASQYSTCGAGFIFLRYVSPDHSRFREYWGNILLSSLTLGGVVVVAIYLASGFLLGTTPKTIILLLAFSDCICGQLTVCVSQIFQTFEKMRITAGLNLLTNLFRLVLAVGMLLTLHKTTGEQWALASLCVSLLASLIAVSTVIKHSGWPQFRPTLLLSRAGEGLVFAISGSTTSAYNDLDKAMLAHYGMSTATGIYTMAYRIVDICSMPIRSIHAAAFPRFFRYGSNGVSQTCSYARKILKRTSCIGIAVAVAMFVAAPLIPWAVGRGFAESTSALRWLCLIPLFRALHLSAGDAMAGAGFQKFRTVYQLLAALTNFSLNAYLIPHYGWIGAAWASLATDGSLGVVSWICLLVLRGEKYALVPEVTGTAALAG